MASITQEAEDFLEDSENSSSTDSGFVSDSSSLYFSEDYVPSILPRELTMTEKEKEYYRGKRKERRQQWNELKKKMKEIAKQEQIYDFADSEAFDMNDIEQIQPFYFAQDKDNDQIQQDSQNMPNLYSQTAPSYTVMPSTILQEENDSFNTNNKNQDPLVSLNTNKNANVNIIATTY
ncbi:MAG: hypothetical protein EZS28_005670 [Streblomastix strix]|uniref:Uncharacterized protein n=1 Tax=Streblomastix strix TaxID=222440 RepID=A0A5J4WWV1_9EUKA|nr:MAG: hypothetical protein EZS28_005670 [Streblomastix strix]